jgi:hypothetical protein
MIDWKHAIVMAVIMGGIMFSYPYIAAIMVG